MLVLTFYQYGKQLDYSIFKLYHKKYSLQVRGEISWDSGDKLEWNIFNSYNKKLQTNNLDLNSNSQSLAIENGLINYAQIIAHPNLSNYTFAIIVHKIACGGADFTEISLLNQLSLDKLTKFKVASPLQQAQDIALAEACLNYYLNSKHYACFDSGFHKSIDVSQQLLAPNLTWLNQGVRNYGTFGLALNNLVSKLSDITDKKSAKGKWIIIYLSNTISLVCALKNGKSKYCSASDLFSLVPTPQNCGQLDPQLIHNLATSQQISPNEILDQALESNLANLANSATSSLEELLNSSQAQAKLAIDYYVHELCQIIAGAGNLLQGIDGIIFSGELGTNSPQLRQIIIDQLAWLGISLSNKANLENQTKLHKKSSLAQVFSLKDSPHEAMLNQLLERI